MSTLEATDLSEPRSVHFVAALLAALGYRVRMSIRTVSDITERRFAAFAGVPYQNPVSRKEWEDLLEVEAGYRGTPASLMAS